MLRKDVMRTVATIGTPAYYKKTQKDANPNARSHITPIFALFLLTFFLRFCL